MIRILRLTAILGSLLLVLPFADMARCELITFEFTGTVTSVTVQNFTGRQNFDFPDVGDPFTGFYTFDSNAPDTANSPEQGSYHTVLPGHAVVVSIGGFEFAGRASGIVTFQDYYGAHDWLPPIQLTSNPSLAQILDRHSFSLVITKEDLFPGPILPLTPPSLAGTELRYLVMRMDSRFNSNEVPYVTINASLDSLTVVPEPLGSVLFGIGILLVLRMRTHRFWT
jgi:hypothetical protein